MRSLAGKYAENETVWGLSGLLHDLGYQITGEDSATHGIETEKILSEKNVLPIILDTIKKHNAKAWDLSGQPGSSMPWPVRRPSPV